MRERSPSAWGCREQRPLGARLHSLVSARQESRVPFQAESQLALEAQDAGHQVPSGVGRWDDYKFFLCI